MRVVGRSLPISAHRRQRRGYAQPHLGQTLAFDLIHHIIRGQNLRGGCTKFGAVRQRSCDHAAKKLPRITGAGAVEVALHHAAGGATICRRAVATNCGIGRIGLIVFGDGREEVVILFQCCPVTRRALRLRHWRCGLLCGGITLRLRRGEGPSRHGFGRTGILRLRAHRRQGCGRRGILRTRACYRLRLRCAV